MANDILDHIILNENAYFYKKEKNSFFTHSHIENIFFTASQDKIGRYLLRQRKQPKTIHGKNVQFSVCIFKIESLPSFIDEEISPIWREQKLAYLLIADFKDYVFISKRNISGVDKILYEGLNVVDYSILNTIFVNDTTLLEKFSLNNTSVAQDSIRGKTVEALDLKRSFSPYGASRYVLNSLRVKNNEEKTSISFNTSRVTKFGEKKYLDELLDWANSIFDKIRAYVQSNSFLDVFAKHVDYESFRLTLRPISFLFNLRKFHQDIESGRIDSCEFRARNGRVKTISFSKITDTLENVFDVEEVFIDTDGVFFLINTFAKDLHLNINKKSITIYSEKFARIFINFENGGEMSLQTYFNRQNDFIINFEDLSLVYTNRKLFEDSKLIGYIDNFIDAFEGHLELNTVISEKGSLTAASTGFSADSIFYFVEDKITNRSNYCFLDDLGNEWADYISIEGNTLNFIHAKYDTTQFSASSFHEIVGQALKNIGNMVPTDDLLTKKSIHWDKTFNLQNSATNIQRLRKGPDVDSSIEKFKSLLLNPNLDRRITIVLNFISKAALHDRLQKLRDNIPFQEKNQVIQILWILSSLINSCQENGIKVKIVCKP